MAANVQSLLFERIKQKAPANISLVDAIAEVLGISNDSAYRRLRGETSVSIDEAFLLAKHFGVAFEELIPSSNDHVLFGRSTFRNKPLDFSEYLAKTEEYFTRIVACREKKGFYSAKDIPVFYFFQSEELARFKLFFWIKTIKENEKISALKFDFNAVPDEFVKQGKNIAKMYFNIPFTELWNEETAGAVLRQINYFHEAGWFAKKTLAIKLCDEFDALINIIQQQAQTELVWYGGKQVHPDVAYELYYNDLVALDNSIYIKTDQFSMTMLSYNAMDYLFTSHHGFCKETENFLTHQIGKSMLLSGAAEKERNKFFNRIQNRIQLLREKINSN